MKKSISQQLAEKTFKELGLDPKTGKPIRQAQGYKPLPVTSRNFPYPPPASRKSPEIYGSLRERLREFTGKNLNQKDFTYELFINYFGLKAEVFSL